MPLDPFTDAFTFGSTLSMVENNPTFLEIPISTTEERNYFKFGTELRL